MLLKKVNPVQMGTFEQVSSHQLGSGFDEMKLKNGTVCNAVWNWQFNGPWKERETPAFEKPFKLTFAVPGPRARLVEQQLQATAAPVWLTRNLSKCFTSVFHSIPPPHLTMEGFALTLMACMKKINCALTAELNCAANALMIFKLLACSFIAFIALMRITGT